MEWMNPDPVKPARQPILDRGRLIAAAVLFVFVVGCITFVWMSRVSDIIGKRAADEVSLVDQSPWQTAHALAGMAATATELEFGREAQRLADHDVDQAFAYALRRPVEAAQKLSGKALAVQKKLPELDATVKQDQAQVDELTRTHAADEDLEITKAQLGLDTDVLNEAKGDLARATGDNRGRIKQELAAHEASMKAYDAQAEKGAAAVRRDNLAGRIGEWLDERERERLVLGAMHQSEATAKQLTKEHNELDARAEKAKAADAPAGKAARLKGIQKLSAQSQSLGILDDRTETERQLAVAYRAWADQLIVQHRMNLNLILQSLALIALILMCGILLDSALNHILSRSKMDRRKLQTLRIIFRIGIQVLCLLSILLVIFGVPRQMPTILGLATAGLTVVFQDFIIAFFGWFILMGTNGIRVGDWVEINGVGGEVEDIGIFRTKLLETGNLTVSGHPTGRRVTFINSYAIKGQYFNFSTAGQWMWDEIRIGIPESDDLYQVVEAIRVAVHREMESTSQIAGEEWKRAASSGGMSQFTAEPAVNLRGAGTGVEVIIRYVTRASERFEVRNRIYSCVINLMHKPAAPGIEAPVSL
jgi:small-conductance mechanosensitive channel